MSIVYLNGKYIEERDAFVPITDRGFLFGDGIFTTIRVSGGIVEHPRDHLNRLKLHCEYLNIIPPDISIEDLQQVITRNGSKKDVWRIKIVVTGGCDTSISLPKRSSGIVLITIKPYIPTIKASLNLAVYPHPIISSVAKVKSLSYLDRLHIKQYAIDHQADEALVCLSDRAICEAAFSNIFWTYAGKLYTPSNDLPFLNGITIDKIIESSDLTHIEKRFAIEDIPTDAQVFLCNSMMGCKPVHSIAGFTYKIADA